MNALCAGLNGVREIIPLIKNKYEEFFHNIRYSCEEDLKAVDTAIVQHTQFLVIQAAT